MKSLRLPSYMGRFNFDKIYCISKIRNKKLDQVVQKFIGKVFVKAPEISNALDTSFRSVTEIKNLTIT